MSALSDRFTNALSLKVVLNRYGYEINRSGFLNCPFHRDDTPSFKVYPDESYHCYSCKSHGNIIDFVQTLFNLSYVDAMKKLDTDFNLHILDTKDESDSRYFYAKKAINKKIKDRNKLKQKISYEQMIDLHRKYHQAIMFDEPYSDLFCKAMLNMTDLQYRLEAKENELYG